MGSYAQLINQGIFLGVAAGNIWSAPFIGGGSMVGWLVVALGMYFPATLQRTQRFWRTGLVATLAWPVAFLWQSMHESAPNLVLGWIQVAILLVSSQVAAWVVERRAMRSEAADEHVGDAQRKE